MTAIRRDGIEIPFSRWLRKEKRLDSVGQNLHVSDVDYSFMKYKTAIDRIGTRQLKLFMQIELKTFGKQLDAYQQEHLFLLHQLLTHQRPLPDVNKVEGFTGKIDLITNGVPKKIRVWSMGVSILTIDDGDSPDDCTGLWWGRFRTNGVVMHLPIMLDQLIGLLNFELHPDTLSKFRLSRHSKTHEGVVIRNDGLFPYEEKVTSRSYKKFQEKLGSTV
jgi:hypothetical protein